jgi:hypothetical protein
MSNPEQPNRHSFLRRPTATQAAVGAEPVPFPVKTAAAPLESFLPDWRRRLTRNLSRRSDSRWEPLTRVHDVEE